MTYPRNDAPTCNDLLGRQEMLRRVAEACLTCPPPYVMGIHGKWGAGKTSFLRQLEYLLNEQPKAADRRFQALDDMRGGLPKNAITVWFEAWRYQHEGNPVAAMLQQIRARLGLKTRLIDKSKKLMTVAAQGMLSLDAITRHFTGVSVSDVRAAGEKYEADHLMQSLDSDNISELLESAINGVLKQAIRHSTESTRRLVVIIDDLDRCRPEIAFRLLEGLKVYLNLRNCVFVLGMDQAVIENTIQEHMPKRTGGTPTQARQYLDKICHDIRQLGGVSSQHDFLRSCLSEECPGKQPFLNISEQYQCLPANPRKIKAFANVLERFAVHCPNKCEAGSKEEHEHEHTQFIMAYLYHFHHTLYELVARYPGFWQELRRWCENPGAIDHPELKRLVPTQNTKESSKGTSPTPAGDVLVDTFPDIDDPDVFYPQEFVAAMMESTYEQRSACVLK